MVHFAEGNLVKEILNAGSTEALGLQLHKVVVIVILSIMLLPLSTRRILHQHVVLPYAMVHIAEGEPRVVDVGSIRSIGYWMPTPFANQVEHPINFFSNDNLLFLLHAFCMRVNPRHLIKYKWIHWQDLLRGIVPQSLSTSILYSTC